jgi:O-antigen/teichoic acid export membrane protein
MADALTRAGAAPPLQAGAATRVAKNTVAQLAAMASMVVSKLLITIVIARMFGPNEVGDFSFVVTFAMLFTFMSTAGLSWSLIRETATHRDAVERYAGNGLSLAMLSGLVTVPLMVGIVSLMGYPIDIRLAVALVGVAMVFESLGQVLNGIFGGLERMELGAYILFAQETVFLLIGGAVLLLRMPFLWLFAVYAPSRLAGFLTGWWLYRRVFGRTLWPRLEWAFIKDLLRTSLPYAVNMALGPIYLRIDVVMLSFYQGSEALGFYEAATTIFYRLNVFARTFNNALLPLMAREFEAEAGRVRRYVRAAVKYQLISGVPLTVACVMLADRLILLIYGSAFESSIIVFRLLTAIVCVQFIDHTLATALTAIGLQSRRSAAVALAAVSNVLINLYFIPAHSFVGAAVTTILTEVIFFSALYAMLSRQPRHRSGPNVPRLLAGQLFLKPGLAGLAMAAVLWVLRGWHLALLVAAGGIVYLGMLWVLGVFTPAEVRFFLRVSRIYRVMPTRMRGAIMCTAKPSEGVK